jgi:hypothetical protein
MQSHRNAKGQKHLQFQDMPMVLQLETKSLFHLTNHTEITKRFKRKQTLVRLKKKIINTPIWKNHLQMTFAPNLKRDFQDNEIDCSYTKVCSAT